MTTYIDPEAVDQASPGIMRLKPGFDPKDVVWFRSIDAEKLREANNTNSEWSIPRKAQATQCAYCRQASSDERCPSCGAPKSLASRAKGDIVW